MVEAVSHSHLLYRLMHYALYGISIIIFCSVMFLAGCMQSRIDSDREESDWGRGVLDLDLTYKRICESAQDGTAWNLTRSQGMVSVVTWKQACTLAKMSPTGTYHRAILFKELFAPWKNGWARFKGMGWGEFVDLVGLPDFEGPNHLRYGGFLSPPNCGRYMPSYLCDYRVYFDNSSKVAGIFAEYDDYTLPSIVDTGRGGGAYYFPDGWGGGVVDLRWFRSQLKDYYEESWLTDYVYGKMMMLSFDQACEVFRLLPPNEAEVDPFLKEFLLRGFATWGKDNFAGSNRTKIRSLLGQPDHKNPTYDIYSEYTGCFVDTLGVEFYYGDNEFLKTVRIGRMQYDSTNKSWYVQKKILFEK